MSYTLFTSHEGYVLALFFMPLILFVLYKLSKWLTIAVMVVDSKIVVFLLAIGWCAAIGVVVSRGEADSFLRWFISALIPVLPGVNAGLRNIKRHVQNQEINVARAI